MRRGATDDALNDHLGIAVTAVEDREARARGEALYDQPIRKRYTCGIGKDDVLNVLLGPGEGLLDFSPKWRP